MKAENVRLAKLLKFTELHPAWQTTPAKVISRDLGDFKDVILIDKGSDDGLQMNMPVVNSSGLIGIIDGVYPHMAKVLLISSPRSRIGGLNLRGDSRAAGIVNGVAGPAAGNAELDSERRCAAGGYHCDQRLQRLQSWRHHHWHH